MKKETNVLHIYTYQNDSEIITQQKMPETRMYFKTTHISEIYSIKEVAVDHTNNPKLRENPVVNIFSVFDVF